MALTARLVKECIYVVRFYNVTGGLPVDIHGPQFRYSSHTNTDSHRHQLDLVSRHQKRHTPPPDPSGFWNVDFPTEDEIIQ
ncbi:hypothetical protein BC938DRAFT_470560 [Jimgerdemannia flammicorona]|uniref:DNA endonuclease activator Ctp1 C-terminal domain-containing protein n=1 Tax=Jimgerdemannia flammicorona TaxID=994334 RepID=A0A433Q9X5_9FUNG|nr:hypothetical protein BC938DRAFT_470560 [Jimgerdemannia flammicorona]